MIICDGFECDNKIYKKGNKCCNDCNIQDCQDRCMVSKKDCGQTREINAE